MYKYLPLIPTDWLNALSPFLSKNCLLDIDKRLLASTDIIFPDAKDIFKAFEETSFSDVTVVFMGQDPYHGKDEACGLAFGVKEGVKKPPSLKNLQKELLEDGQLTLTSSDLVDWARQGVLLLNRTLTVSEGQPLSHKHLGWDFFIDAVMKAIMDKKTPVIFVALGKESERFFKSYSFSMPNHHKVLSFPHPSPLSAYRGFFGSKIFSQINKALLESGLSPIRFGSKL
jgi:uracil-DNA glycosylase